MSRFLPLSILVLVITTVLIFITQNELFAATFAATFAGGVLSAYIVTKFILIPRFRTRGLIGVDMNKLEKPEVPEMGGIGVMFGFAFAIMVALAAYRMLDFTLNLTAVLAAFSTVFIVGVIGILDDLVGWKKGIEQWQHALFPIFAALPLMVLPDTINTTVLTLPFFGPVNFGILYSLLVVPIAITGASNAVNMLAGFNGLEAGIGSLIAATFIAIALFKEDPSRTLEVVLLMAALLGSLLAFLRFNWFPAKVFPGDSLTLMMGAAFAAAAIVGNIEKIGLGLFALYFVELLFKAKHRFKSECFGLPQEDGTLQADPRGGSLTHFIMRLGRFTEGQVVCILFGLQLLVSAAVFALFWFKLF